MQRCSPPFRVVLLVALTVAVATPSLAGDSRSRREARDEQAAIIPVDATPEPLDPAERALRRLRSGRYDNLGMQPLVGLSASTEQGDEAQFSVTHSSDVTTPLPVVESNAIVIGEVVSAQPYLSNDGTGIYSEFAIRLEQVLKNDCCEGLHSSGIVVAEREGGALRLSNGHVLRYRTEDGGLPAAGLRYVFFLGRNEREDDFSILRLYELRGSHVVAMDSVAPEAGLAVGETGFLKELRAAIVNSQ